jgi:hypothetical protein
VDGAGEEAFAGAGLTLEEEGGQAAGVGLAREQLADLLPDRLNPRALTHQLG